jgi:DNA polymerase
MELQPYDILRWHVAAGADEAIGETAVDRFATSAKAVPPPRPVDAAAPEPRRVPAMPHAAMPHAAEPGTSAHQAAEAVDLAALRAAMEAFEGLPLKAAATSTVFGDGNPEAGVMCIGEAPGQEEDRQGLPFVGASGKLLDRMLASIGLDRQSAYITNILPWRPPANRKPTSDEVAACLPFVSRHIDLIDPQLLILFGGAAASALLARGEGINRLRGRWFEYSSPGLPRPIPAIATFHPEYLLCTPEAKREAWHDLLMVKKRLEAGHQN